MIYKSCTIEEYFHRIAERDQQGFEARSFQIFEP
jgi:hypothetical protein